MQYLTTLGTLDFQAGCLTLGGVLENFDGAKNIGLNRLHFVVLS